MARLSKGRQKIAMTKMSKKSNLLVTFSKRRVGVFKKASELCTLCGVEIAVIVFSSAGPGKKVFSFGHPNVEQIIDTFISSQNSNPATNSGILQPVEPHLTQLNTQLTELHNQLVAEKTRGVQLTDERTRRQGLDWWEAPIEDLGLEELQRLKSGLNELKTQIANQTRNLVMMQQAHNFASSSSGGGEAADGSAPALGIIMTPQGFALS